MSLWVKSTIKNKLCYNPYIFRPARSCNSCLKLKVFIKWLPFSIVVKVKKIYNCVVMISQWSQIGNSIRKLQLSWHSRQILRIQGHATGFDIQWRPWRPSKNNFYVKMKVFVYFWGLGIWVSSTSFQKSNIGWPQQPPSERVPYISEKLDFWWSIPQKMTSIGDFLWNGSSKI